MSSLLNNSHKYKKTNGGVELRVSAPGKVILHGEHSVVYGKLAVAASLGLRTRVHLVELDAPNVLTLRLHQMNCEYTFSLDEVAELLLENPPALASSTNLCDFNWETPKLINHTSHLEVVDLAALKLLKAQNLDALQAKSVKCLLYLLSGILSTANVKPASLLVAVDSELDIGAGTGSSASYSVTLAAALIHYLKLKSFDMDNVSLQGFKPFKWTSQEIEEEKRFSERQLHAISEWAFSAEKIFHGTPSGLDNTICTYGHMVKFRKNHAPSLIKLSTSLNVLLINTKVPRETSKLVSHVAGLKEKFPQAVENILNAIEEVTTSALGVIGRIDCEGAEVEQYYEDLVVLVQMNHSLLSALGVSHAKLEEIMTILDKHGLKGKLTGAGGGGFAISILPPSFDAEEVIKKLKEGGFSVISTKLGGDGVRVD